MRGFGSFRALLFGVHERIGPAHCVLVGAPPFPRPSDIRECGHLCERYIGFAEAGVLAVSCANLTFCGNKCDFRAVHRSVLCRSWRELSNEYLLFTCKFGFDTAENGPLKVCQKLAKSLRMKVRKNIGRRSRRPRRRRARLLRVRPPRRTPSR